MKAKHGSKKAFLVGWPESHWFNPINQTESSENKTGKNWPVIILKDAHRRTPLI